MECANFTHCFFELKIHHEHAFLRVAETYAVIWHRIAFSLRRKRMIMKMKSQISALRNKCQWCLTQSATIL